MDISTSSDRDGLTTIDFDMEILTSLTNTDLLIRLIKDQIEETAVLKNQLSSFNSSAMKMKDCYTTEKKKNDQIECENRQLLLRVKTLEENLSQLNNNLINEEALHEQKVAELENRLTVASRCLILQRSVLKANRIKCKDSNQHYNDAKEFLQKRGEVVIEDVVDTKLSSKKKRPATANAATMTDQCDSFVQKKAKQFCDKSTMHCPMVSTATRGTTTSTFIQKADVATNFPEPMAIDVHEIFRIMIDDMPPAITPIDDLPAKTKCTQTEPPTQSNCNVGTITRIRNIRRKINFVSEYSQPSPTASPLCRVKKEKEDSIPDLLNLQYSSHGAPINQKLTQLWQMVGQMIFAIIGNGEVFNHSNNMSLINDNLNQIRRVIEMESQPEIQDHNMEDCVEEPSYDDFGTTVVASGFSLATGHNNASAEASVHARNIQSPPHIQQSSIKELQTNTPLIHQTQSTSSFTQTHNNSADSVPLSADDTSSCTKIHNNSANSVALTATTSVQCETENIFKKPILKTKRKLVTDNCPVRKRICQRKTITKPERSAQCGNYSSSDLGTFVVPADRIEQSLIDDPDASLVEDIFRYFKMPSFVEMIVDPPHVVTEADRARTVEVTELLASSNEPTELTSATESSDLSTESMAYDEFESPASPPPPSSTPSPYQAPVIIPTSPKKLNCLVVEGILANFDKRKRMSLKQRKLKVPTAEEEQIIASTRHRVERYLTAEWTGGEIDDCCNDLSTVRPVILSKCIVEVVMNTNSEHLSREFTPPAPSLPKTHQKVIVLIKRISQLVNGFDDLVLFQLEKIMFVLGDEQVSIAEGLNLTHLFIGLTDCMDVESKWSCVLFVYKCLYYFAIKAVPMVYAVLMAYPAILPQFDEGENVTDFLRNTANILQATFVIILINTNLSESNVVKSSNGLKRRDLSTYLKTYYHYPCMRPTIDDFVDILVDRLTNSHHLANISYSLILIAKRNGTVWADDMVQRKLLPQLNHFLLTISDGAANDERIAILISAISSIIKTFPITKDITSYQQLFYKILDSTTRQTIQEEAVMALLRTSRFGMVDVYKRICDWRPSAAVRRQCHSMLSTFLYRQNLSYWQNF